MSYSIKVIKANANPAEFPSNLTARERQVLEAVAEHGSRKAVARQLGISIPTLNDHLKACNLKAGVHTSVVLVARYLKATLGAQA